jgi:hypothetical protein
MTPTICRSHTWRAPARYRALGYDEPYRWAHFADVPFTPVAQAAEEGRIRSGDDGSALPSCTAIRVRAARPQQGCQVPLRLRAYHRAIPMCASRTHLRPHAHHRGGLEQLVPRPAEARRRRSRTGSVAPRFYGAPTTRSQRSTWSDAPDILRPDGEDKVDAACWCRSPVCHADHQPRRAISSAGIPTVIMGCARTSWSMPRPVPRFLFSDFRSATPRQANDVARKRDARSRAPCAGERIGAAHDRAIAATLVGRSQLEARLR